MKRVLEPVGYAVLILVLGFLNVAEGRRQARLEQQLPLTPKELYQTLARAQVQVVDVRPDPSENYEGTHIPGAIPFPGCDAKAVPEVIQERILPSVPTVVVSDEGSRAEHGKCLGYFVNARNLAGGMKAWSEAGLPEDSGEYSPPKPGAGGGCL
ncbi:MAG: rhodanese-like domain-containing protein [Myxococcota bacterium]